MIRDRFITICQEAMVADSAAGGTNCRVLEPFFYRIIDLANPIGDNRELKECFFGIVRGEIEAPYETLGYCIRALRYREVAEESRKRLGNPPDPRWMNIHSDIMHALEDDVWEDADLWLRMV
jgi:hypothetical protein